ncbi:MAG: NAD-glutamate dehydrogenase [Zetaproteobacteria bacterium]|nr:NAD-glutamate dehydrogenase [Zetaproteobacteria bacterium]
MRTLRQQLIQLFTQHHPEFIDRHLPARLQANLLHDALALLPHDQAVPTRFSLSIRTISHDKLHRHLLLIRCPDQAFYFDAIKAYLFQRDIQSIKEQTLIASWDSQKRQIHPPTSTGQSIMLIAIHLSATLLSDPDQLLNDIEAILLSVDQSVLDFNAMHQQLAHIGACLKDDAANDASLLEWIREDRYLLYGFESAHHQLGLMHHRRNMNRVVQYLHRDIFNLPKATKPSIEWLHLSAIQNHLYSRNHLEVLRLCWQEHGALHQAILIGHLSRSARYSNATQQSWLQKQWNEIRQQSEMVQSTFYAREIRTLYDRMPKPLLHSVSSDQWYLALKNILQINTPLQISHAHLIPNIGDVDLLLITVARKRFGPNILHHVKQNLAQLGLKVGQNTQFTDAGNFVLFALSIEKRVEQWPDALTLENAIQECIKFWKDRAKEAILACTHCIDLPRVLDDLSHVSPLYESMFPPEQFLMDIQKVDPIVQSQRSFIRLRQDGEILEVHLLSAHAMLLGRIVRMMQGFGLVCIENNVAELGQGGRKITINRIRCAFNGYQDSVMDHLKDALEAVVNGEADDDPINHLILLTPLKIGEVAILITLRNHLVQLYPQASSTALSNMLNENPEVATRLYQRFYTIHSGALPTAEDEDALNQAFAAIKNLNDDQWLRHFLILIQASLRTNGLIRQNHDPIAIKIDPSLIPGLPQPVPYREIFVHGRMMQGIHLRAGKVARGGIRFSDRPDDFRSEVHGLMATQVVKNGQILPTGAKGGFIVQHRWDDLSESASSQRGKRTVTREEILSQYQQFIRALLSLSDNLSGDQLLPPHAIYVPQEDQNDPYLVVAADKGTASFSDEANAISQTHHFWLDDAFASGGKHGYDHKAIGITARGAWVCAAHHLQSHQIDAWQAPLTVVGIGDMSGDVFGNGLLLNPHTQLIAAFNHAYIFLDPNPNQSEAFAERQRLFTQGFNWDQYNRALISHGGGVFDRGSKTIFLSHEVRQALDINADECSGEALIQAILSAPVDMLYNGGIGTYIKAACESHQEILDPANNSVRIDAEQLRCKTVCEGGNLGVTQLARLLFAAKGGLINTDAIDNAAGVHMSDREVNIKILFSATSLATMPRAERNKILKQMTHEVTEQCLAHNQMQARALSLAAYDGANHLPRLMRLYTYLNDHHYLYEKHAQCLGISHEQQLLLKPQLSMVLGCEKNRIHACLDVENFADWSCFSRRFLMDYFPKKIQRSFAAIVPNHPMASGIVHIQVCNHVINHFGLTTPFHIESLSTVPISHIVHGLLLADELLQTEKLRHFIWALPKLDDALALQTSLHQVIMQYALDLIQQFDMTLCDEVWMVARKHELKLLKQMILSQQSVASFEPLLQQGLNEEMARHYFSVEAMVPMATAVHVVAHDRVDQEDEVLSELIHLAYQSFQWLPFKQLESSLQTPLWGKDEPGHNLRREWLHRLSILKSKAIRQVLHASSKGVVWAGQRHWLVMQGILQNPARFYDEIENHRLQLIVYLTQLESLIDETVIHE